MACKDCKFLDVPLDAAGRRRVIKNRMYNCTVPTPVFPPIPASMEVKIHEARHDVRRLWQRLSDF